MAVVKNLMVRIGADYSPAKKAMQGATRDLGKFKRDVTKTTSDIRGQKGLGGVSTEFKTLGREVSASLSRIRGSKGIGGVASEVKTLVPLLGRSATAMRGLGTEAAGVGARFGVAGIAVAAFGAILGAVTVGLYQASQAAIKYEADLGRLNMQLRGGARDFMQWARAQGLAKSTSAELGATYGTLISSFISDNKQLQESTKEIVHATRIVSSATGRSIEETLERMRSGLLGNTEAIEDLGIFVNVSMIESTKAFQKFANGKSWDQLDFRLQQQIRLAAILEQTYARYGNELQNNVMSKQTRLMEQLKDVKLHLSQAFLPIWDAVLPALTRLAESVANTTEQLARFVYRLRGWDYDEQTQGADQQTDAVNDLGKSYESAGKKAQKAIAAFDQLNLIGGSSGSGGGSGGGIGGGGSSGLGVPGGNNGGSPGTIPMPKIPPLPKLQLQFDPPSPPDAGAGAVATAVTSTINQMNTEAKMKFAQMWADLNAQTQVGSTQVSVNWNAMLAGMLSSLLTHRPLISTEWSRLNTSVESISNPLTRAQTDWKATLSFMQQQLNAYRPYLEYGWALLRTSVLSVRSPLSEIKTAWSSTLSNMQSAAASKLGSIIGKVNEVTSALSRMKQALNPVSSPATSPVSLPAAKRPAWAKPMTSPEPSFGQNLVDTLKFSVSPETLSKMAGVIQKEASKPQNQAAASIYSALLPIGKLGQLGKGASGIGDFLKQFPNLFKGVGIPAFANGAMVYGPTLAMVGDNAGARTDPEVIAPLSDLEAMIEANGDNHEMVMVLRSILQAVRENRTVQAVIARDDVGRAARDFINDEARRGRNPLPAL